MASTATTAPTLTPAQALQAALQAVVTAAQADLIDPTVTADQVAAARQVLALAQSSLLLLQVQTTGQTPTTYVVGYDDLRHGGLFGLAARLLGDATRFGDIQAANGLRGLALSVGQVLIVPAA